MGIVNFFDMAMRRHDALIVRVVKGVDTVARQLGNKGDAENTCAYTYCSITKRARMYLLKVLYKQHKRQSDSGNKTKLSKISMFTSDVVGVY